MNDIKWDLKSNYILALTVCKYGTNFDCWTRVANDLAFYIKTTAENCKTQFDYLCQQYGQDWREQTNEPLHNYILSVIKRAYYSDLYTRMTESRELLMVMYDFIRLFRCGKITSNDINMILQDIKNSVPSDNNQEYNEQQNKIKMLERLKFHMIQQMSQTSDVQSSVYPVELLPPPLPPPPPPSIQQQQQSLLNDRQVPSITNHLRSNPTELSSFPTIIQSANLLVDEIELSSDNDNDNDNDRQATNSNHINDHNELTFISDEQIETNISSNIQPLTNDNSLSNSSTDETRTTSSINGQSTTSNIPLNTSLNGSNDFGTLDSDRITSTTINHRDESIESQSTPRRISIDDDDVARMDAEQTPEIIPTDITNVPQTNDNAILAVDDLDSNSNQQKMSILIDVKQQNLTLENHCFVKENTHLNKSRLNQNSTSIHFRKIVCSILSNLKTAKYNPDFTKSLKSFRLSNDYYDRIKHPLDIPDIRERMINGDYDQDFLSFERDVLLMFTNALLHYDREHDIHGHARYMIDYAMELFTPVEEACNPWKTIDFNDTNGNSLDVCQTDQDNDTDDDTLTTRTPSIASTTSSVRLDSSTMNVRRSRTSNHPMSKRQRKTLH